MPSLAETDKNHYFTWSSIRDIALEHRPQLILANGVAILATLATVPVPLLMPLLVDEVLLEKPGVTVNTINQLFPASWQSPVFYILVILLLSVVLRLIAIGFNVYQTRLFTIIAKDITFRLRSTLIHRLQSISMAEYETLGSGRVVAHMVTDINTIDGFVGSAVSRFLIAVLTLTGTAVILLWMHWQLALFIIFLNPLVIFFTMLMGKRVKDLKKKENSAVELFQQTLAETLDAIHQIRSSNREKHYISQLIDSAAQVKTSASSFAWRSDAANRLSFLIFLFGFDGFRALAMIMVLFSDLSIGQMLAVFGYLWFMMSPVQEILGMQFSLFGAKAALGRINQLMDLKLEPRYPHLVNPFTDKKTVAIHIENLQFAYGSGQNVLNGITMDIKAGEKIALVGASGGGKSTFIQVLIGLYPPTAGSIYFDGVPVTDIGLDIVRENVATVLQHPAMFNDTIRANLTLGRHHSDQELWKALEIAQLREMVEGLEHQLESIVGRSGTRLSGGQRQRLAAARMVLSNPKVVILDEATSALDTETEDKLHSALSDFLLHRTTIIIAHRLSAVKQADRVYVFEDGWISEQGGHDELIDQKGLYAKLYGDKQR